MAAPGQRKIREWMNDCAGAVQAPPPGFAAGKGAKGRVDLFGGGLRHVPSTPPPGQRLYYALIVKRIAERTRSRTPIDKFLRD